jgi:hypothetical protein
MRLNETTLLVLLLCWAGGVVFLDRGSANQFFVAIFVALVFLVVDTFVRPYHDFRCNALKVLTSMSMLITLLCGFASKLDWRNEVVSDDTLGWTLIVSGQTHYVYGCTIVSLSVCGDQISNFIIILLVLSLELIRRLLSVYRGVRSGISYIKNTETGCPLTGVKSYEGEFRKSADEKAVAVTVKAFPMNKYLDSRLVHAKVQELGEMPHIGKIYGTEVEGGVLFVATVPPQATLASHIENFHTCPAIGEDFCRALIQSLEVLHGANIANKNIRPEHIALDGCNIQLADFSSAKAFESDVGSPTDFIVDKHMLACTILYTLSGGLDADGDPLELRRAHDSNQQRLRRRRAVRLRQGRAARARGPAARDGGRRLAPVRAHQAAVLLESRADGGLPG